MSSKTTKGEAKATPEEKRKAKQIARLSRQMAEVMDDMSGVLMELTITSNTGLAAMANQEISCALSGVADTIGNGFALVTINDRNEALYRAVMTQKRLSALVATLRAMA